MNPSFLIVPDSFKDCMPAPQVGTHIARGIGRVFENARLEIIPMADGGEGTVQSIMGVCGGKMISTRVKDPLGRSIDSFFGVASDGQTAFIEMAAASGLERLTARERNPWITSTYGTGQLIKAALDYGCSTIMVGVGGSATNDGGMGMARALGVKFLDHQQCEIPEGGGSLHTLATIDRQGIDSRLAHTQLIAASDVVSPLTGPQGASQVFAAQKGATVAMVQDLEHNLRHFAQIIHQTFDVDISQMPGGGAAGGLAAGMHVFLGATIRPGFDAIAALIGLDDKIRHCTVIIGAEGRVDAQTLAGKTPVGLGSLARKYQKPLFIFTGNACQNTRDLYAAGISSLIPICRKPGSLKQAMAQTGIWLEKAAEELCLVLKTGKNL